MANQEIMAHITSWGCSSSKTRESSCSIDCSSGYRGTSLNNQLISGPGLTNQLVLARFREDQVAFTTDVQAMFYQVYPRIKEAY